MNFTDEGVVLTARKLGESDRLCAILTKSHGIIRAFAKNGAYIKNKNFSATSQLSYSRFTLFTGRERYIIDETECIDLNYDLRLDPDKLTLASYFCELMLQLAHSEDNSDEFLRLLRGGFYYLASGSRSRGIIKAAFEMRAVSLAGFMPDLIMCSGCGCYTSGVMYFSPKTGKLSCGDCGAPSGSFALDPSTLTALRHTVYADMKKLFSFMLPDEKLDLLCSVCESYLIEKTERSYRTLELYKAMNNK